MLVTPDDILEIINSLSISRAEFARRTFVTRSYVTHLLTGKKENPSKLFASQVARMCHDNDLHEVGSRIEQRVKEG